MKKKRNTSLQISDRIVLCVCLAGMAFSLYKYFADVYRTASRTDVAPIAFLSSKTRTVHRRFHDRLVWDMLKEDSPLYIGDFVRTGAASEAVITFNSGAIINMGRDSLIEILPESEAVHLKISTGSISIKTPQRLTLQAGNELIEIEKDSIVEMSVSTVSTIQEITTSGTGATAVASAGGAFGGAEAAAPAPKAKVVPSTNAQKISVDVQQGRLVQNRKDGTVVAVDAGSQLVFDEHGEISQAPALMMLSPKQAHRIVKSINDKTVVEFQWKALNYPEGAATKIEIAYDKDFSYPYQSATVADSSSVSFELPNRMMYWKAYPVSGGAALKDLQLDGTISVFSAMPIKKLQPIDNTRFAYKAAQSGIGFSWTEDSFAANYRLVISAGEDLSEPVYVQNVKETSSVIDLIDEGTWYWQVSSVYDKSMQVSPVETPVYKFTVLPKLVLSAPVCNKPQDNEVHYTSNGRQPLMFSWQNERNAVSYKLLIADNPRLKNPLVEIETAQLYYSLVPSKFKLEEGKAWYWGLCYTDAEGEVSPVSQIRTFYMLESPPFYRAVAPQTGLKLTDEELKETIFTIESNMPLESRFEAARDSAFTDLAINAAISSKSFKISSPLKEGVYYWRLKCGNFTTEARTFEVVDVGGLGG